MKKKPAAATPKFVKSAKKPVTTVDLTKEDEKSTLVVDEINPRKKGFAEKVTPIPLSESKIFLAECACGGVHYRHAGYLKVLLPFMKGGGDKSIAVDNVQVMVCCSCKKSTIWIDGQMYDVSENIDLQAWDKTETELHRATGPGGQC